MNIRFKQSHGFELDGSFRYVAANSERDYLPDDLAQNLIERGIAEAVQPAPKPEQKQQKSKRSDKQHKSKREDKAA